MTAATAPKEVAWDAKTEERWWRDSPVPLWVPISMTVVLVGQWTAMLVVALG